MASSFLGSAPLKAPSPNARTLNGPNVPWSGAEGESVPDPVTPGVSWVGGPRGGTRVEALTHVPAGTPNGGDVAVAPRNLVFRQINLPDMDAGLRRRKEVHAAPFREAKAPAPADQQRRLPYKLDPNWIHPLEEAGGDPERMRELTFHDVVQSILRVGEEGGVYCSPPEKWGHRQIVMDLLTAPWVFPWRSPLLPYCSSARKLYAMALAQEFKFRVPGLPGRILDRSQFFELVFVHLLPSFPDLSFNAKFLTTTGLDDCSHVEIQARSAMNGRCKKEVTLTQQLQVSGTHTGAPFAPFGWKPLQASGKRIALPQEFLRLRIHEMAVLAMAADPLPQGQEHLGFPTGIYVLLGGDLPGF